MLTFAMYTGDAKVYPSNGKEYSFPNVEESTFACVSAISPRFCPVRIRSLWKVKTPATFDTYTIASADVDWAVAVTVCAPTVDGGVYCPPTVMVPTVALPPATPSTDQVTLPLPGPVAVYC